MVVLCIGFDKVFLKIFASGSCMLVKDFNQKLWFSSSPGAFQLWVRDIAFCISSNVMVISSMGFMLLCVFISLVIHVACFLCSTGCDHIFPQKIFLSVEVGEVNSFENKCHTPNSLYYSYFKTILNVFF